MGCLEYPKREIGGKVLFNSFFQDSGEKLRKIIRVLFVIEVVLLVVFGIFAIGFAWLAGITAFLISLVVVPVGIILSVLMYYLSILPTYVIADTACRVNTCNEKLDNLLKTRDEREAADPDEVIDPRELPTWKQVQMLKRGQMVQLTVNEEGKRVCPICNAEHHGEFPACEKCGMLFFTK